MKTTLKNIILFISTLSSGMAVAHPGHGAKEQLHSLLHNDYLVILLAIVAVLIAKKVIQKLP